jgi:DNA-binding SARP family transcriptional activator
VSIEVRVLGRFSVRTDGEEVPQAAFRGRLVRKLIRILATRRGQFVSRDVLSESLWPAGLPSDPVNSLNVLVNRSRQALSDPALIVTSSGGYSFADRPGCTIDADLVLEALGTGREHLAAGRPAAALDVLAGALATWGEALAEDSYDDWAQPFRSRLARAQLDALETAAGAALAVGEAARATSFAEAASVLDPLRESSHALLARSLAASGDVAGALAVLDGFRRRLADELGLDPSEDLRGLELGLLRGGQSLRGSPSAPSAAAFAELPFVGRERELEAILTRLAQGGPGAAILVSGAPGSGKSRLLTEVAARSPFPVLAAGAHLTERGEPWALGRTLLRSALASDPAAALAIPVRAAQALADVLPELEELRPLGSAVFDPETRGTLALEAGVRLVEAAVPGPGVLLVDDLQWADPTSSSLLRMLAVRIPRLTIGLAFRAGQVEAGSHPARVLAELERRSSLVRAELGALPAEAVGRLVDDEAVAAVLAGETDGTPFAVAELMRSLVRLGALHPAPGGRWQVRSGSAASVALGEARAGKRRALEQRIALQNDRSRRVLALLALAGREIPARVLAGALELPQPPVLEALDALAASGLVRLGEQGWRTGHDLITETVADSLEAGTRARFHGLLVDALGAEGADPRELAHHLAAAGDGPAAAESLGEAARRSLSVFANDEAHALADQALALAPPARRPGLLEIRSEARSRSGDIAGARADLRGALEGAGPGSPRSRILARMALLASGADDLVHAAELAQLAIVEAARDPAARAGALAVGAVIDMNAGRSARARDRFDEALTLYTAAGDARGVAGILDAQAMEGFMAGRAGEAPAAFDRAAKLLTDCGELLRAVGPRSTCGHALVMTGRPAEGLPHVEEALELARALNYPEGEAYALWHRAEVAVALGRGEEALADAEAALALAEQIGHREWTAASLRGVGLAQQCLGDAAGAEDAFRRSLALSEQLPLFRAWAAARLCLLLAAQGRLAEAEPFAALAAGGPLISGYEARMARLALMAARGDEDVRSEAARALAAAEAGGYLSHVAQLRRWAG